MEFSVVISVIASLLGLVLYKLWRHKSSSLQHPPGPPKLPVIGHLHLLARAKAPPHVYFAQLAKKHGPVMLLQLGSRPFVLVSTKGAAREFLKTMDPIFASRPQYTPVGRILLYDHKDLGMAPYGDHWRQTRKLVVADLLEPRRLESMRPRRMQELILMLQEISTLCGQVVDMRAKLSDLTLNFVFIMLIGKRYFGQDAIERKESEKFVEMTKEIFLLFAQFSIGECLPWLRWLDLDKVESRFKALAKTSDEFIENIIQEHRNNRKPAGDKDENFVDYLLRLQQNGEQCLQGNGLKGLLLEFFTGAADTSTVTLEWALAELVKSPQSMAKLQEEISRIVGNDRLVQESDIWNLPYLQAVIKETFRLHPAGPLMLPRSSTADCKVMGYDISKDTTLLVNVHAIGRDSALWQNPHEFNPERFVGSDIDVKGRDFELIPFGAGRRICPGMNLGMRNVHFVLANLVHAFDWREPEGNKIDTENEIFGTTLLMAKKLELIASARLPAGVLAM